MAKQSQLDKAIAALKADRAVLDLAIAKLCAQQMEKPAKPRKQKASPATRAMSELEKV